MTNTIERNYVVEGFGDVQIPNWLLEMDGARDDSWHHDVYPHWSFEPTPDGRWLTLWVDEERVVGKDYDGVKRFSFYWNDADGMYEVSALETDEESKAKAFIEENRSSDPRLGRMVVEAEMQIIADQYKGAIPKDATTFAELHDHVDANEYWKLEEGEVVNGKFIEMADKAGAIVDGWLKARAK